MTRARILLIHWVHPEIVGMLPPYGEVSVNPTRDSWPQKVLLQKVHEAEAMMVFMPDRVDTEFLHHSPRLRIVAGVFKGVDNIDVPACTEKGVWVGIVPDLLVMP